MSAEGYWVCGSTISADNKLDDHLIRCNLVGFTNCSAEDGATETSGISYDDSPILEEPFTVPHADERDEFLMDTENIVCRPKQVNPWHQKRGFAGAEGETLKQDVQGWQVLLYPNPVSDKLVVDVSHLLPGTVALDLTIHDLQGRLVAQQRSVLSAGSNLIDVDLFNLAPGAYNVQLEGEGFKQSETILIAP